MLPQLRARHSAITFDVGAAGLRAYQLRQRGPVSILCDALQFERPPFADAAAPAAPAVDPVQLDRLIGQGHFSGRDVGLVLSPPDVQFFPLRLPAQALAQAPERIEQALKWEVAQETRGTAEDLEVRHWRLPLSASQQANVMAVAAPAKLVLHWCDLLQQHHLSLRRIDVAPCALVRLCRAVWTPANTDLWGVLDLGLRHSTLTVVVGTVPTYVRCLSISAHQWTRKLADAFEVSCTVAEQLKREQLLHPTDRGLRTASGNDGLRHAADLSSAFWGVLRDSIQTLALEAGRCFSYVMHTFPDLTVKRLFLAGGGAGLSGLPGILENELGVPVITLATAAIPAWERPLHGVRLEPQAAAALGGALLDLDCPGRARSDSAHACSVNLVPNARLHARIRARRRLVWIAACSGFTVLLATGWGAERTASQALTHLADNVGVLELQRTEVQRRLVLATARQTRLLEQLQSLAAARRPQPWAGRLVTLTREAPDGVFLTGVQIGAPAVDGARPKAGTPPSGSNPTRAEPQSRSATPEFQAVKLLGYAVDHAALLQFLNTLQSLPDWRQVELVRATQEPFQTGQAVNFELECRAPESDQ